MRQRTEHEIVQLGSYVENLFQNDQFNILVDEFNQQSVECMLRTEPHEQKAREGIYARINGVRDFLDLMRLYIDAKNQIIENHERPSDPDGD